MDPGEVGIKEFHRNFHLVETTREGGTTAKQVVANRRRYIFLTEVGLEVYTLFRYGVNNVNLYKKKLREIYTYIIHIIMEKNLTSVLNLTDTTKNIKNSGRQK